MSEHTMSFDVVVLGGGPAGALCALLLARAGMRTCLLHRPALERGTVELISGRARRMLQPHLGAGIEAITEGVQIDETVSAWETPEPMVWSAMCNPWGAGIAVERLDFDVGLRHAAYDNGAILLCGSARRIRREDGRWRMELAREAHVTDIDAGLFVVAGGRAMARLPERTGHHEAHPAGAQIALTTRIPSATGSHRAALFLEAVDAHAWWYALPDQHGGHFIGYCAHPASIELGRNGASLPAFLLRRLAQSRLMRTLTSAPRCLQPVTGHAAGACHAGQAGGDDWIAIGDAAYASDALSGQGMEFCINSAVRAATLLLAGSTRSDLDNYQQWIDEHADAAHQARRHFDHLANVH